MRIDDLLKIAIEMDASDVHVKAGNHPQLRVHGVLVPMTQLPRLTAQDTEDLTGKYFQTHVVQSADMVNAPRLGDKSFR